MKFAAIDIGSNAVRLLLARVFEEEGQPAFFKKEALVRMPLRLGDDAFTRHEITAGKADRLVSTMTGFRHLIEAYEPIDYMACATSAMREATNGDVIAQRVRERSAIDLQIIGGKQEAEIIYANHLERQFGGERAYLYIDVGGGSTELTLFARGRTVASRSFRIGTVRLLEDLVPARRWHEMRAWVREAVDDIAPIQGIGSGGNINKLFRLAQCKEGKPLGLKRLKAIFEMLNAYTYEQRIRVCGLRADRADVIIPAAQIYLAVMGWAGIKKIHVPEVGLADGVVHILYEKHLAGRQGAAA